MIDWFDKDGFLLESEELLYSKNDLKYPILNCLKNSFGYFEPLEEYQNKKKIFREIREIVKKFTETLAGNLKKTKENSNVHVLHYGSSRMGIHSPFGDLDLVCIFPNFVNRQN